MLLRRAIASPAGFPPEPADLIGPLGLGANSLLGERFDAVANECTAVLINCAFDAALIVINEESAQIDKKYAVFLF